MAPYRNPLETRSRRYAPRQYVSESHDHKPDAPTRLQPRDERVTPIEGDTDAGTE